MLLEELVEEDDDELLDDEDDEDDESSLAELLELSLSLSLSLMTFGLSKDWLARDSSLDNLCWCTAALQLLERPRGIVSSVGPRHSRWMIGMEVILSFKDLGEPAWPKMSGA